MCPLGASHLKPAQKQPLWAVGSSLNAPLAQACSQTDLSHVSDIRVKECGCTELNGLYKADGLRDGVPSYRQVGGSFTIERDSAPGQLTQWCICKDYGFESVSQPFHSTPFIMRESMPTAAQSWRSILCIPFHRADSHNFNLPHRPLASFVFHPIVLLPCLHHTSNAVHDAPFHKRW